MEGGLAAVDPAALASLLGGCAPLRGGSLELVVLQGCCTLPLGRAVLAAGVPFVVCWSTPTEDGACRLFSSAFFERYAARRRAAAGAERGSGAYGGGAYGGGDGAGATDGRHSGQAHLQALADYLQAFEHAIAAITLATRPGKCEGGLPVDVPKYELRDPALPSSQAFRPRPWAAGCPVLLHRGGEERRGEERPHETAAAGGSAGATLTTPLPAIS